MKRLFACMIVLMILCLWVGPVFSHNPFTSKPETQHQAPKPLLKSPIFVKIILWQHQLKQKMSKLIRVAQSEGRIKPLMVLIGLSFLYGLIHAAGPGHGKVVAMSYVLSHRTTLLGGIIFGLSFAAIHASSGAVGVVGLRYIIQRSVSETLASVTTITQIISFGLIALLGLVILLKHGYSCFHVSVPEVQTQPKNAYRKGVFTWAMAVGLVPCPAVVLVMLFCLSMDEMILGLFLAASISVGMATTISFVVMVIVSGKTGIFSILPKNYAFRVEGVIGLITGGATVIFGTLLLLTTISSILD